MSSDLIGPILIVDTIDDTQMHLAALFIAPTGHPPPPVETEDRAVLPEPILSVGSETVWRARFACSIHADSRYRWNGESFALASDLRADMRIAFASCNGEEHGDLERDPAERNAMWGHLGGLHDRAPFSLLLHGGDQVYADEATKGHPLSQDWPEKVPDAPSAEDLADLDRHLTAKFFERYRALYAAPEFAYLAARVPSLMQWDDHDICDGWGSLPARRTQSEVGQCLFRAARRVALALQHGTRDGDLPARFHDPKGAHLGWTLKAPGLHLLAPDLRSERRRRQVMGQGGWQMMEAAADAPHGTQCLVMSSVPLLGPRLSVLEALMVVIPKMQKYEDDLRDQWQSRAHRAEWRRMLRLMMRVADRMPVTVLSGEIHLATRATMALSGARRLQQLVASGIAHRAPPKAWARALGLLAWAGEAPLDGHPIRIHPLPGQRRRYIAERNALILARRSGEWVAHWELEDSGATPALRL